MNGLALSEESFLLRVEQKLSELIDDSLFFRRFLHGRNNSEEGQQNFKTLLGGLKQDEQERPPNLNPPEQLKAIVSEIDRQER